jgi:hypothetical protein
VLVAGCQLAADVRPRRVPAPIWAKPPQSGTRPGGGLVCEQSGIGLLGGEFATLGLRDSFPFLPISRRMAEYSVAAGVFPPGLVQSPFAAIASIISPQVIGWPASARTLAAAAMALTFFGGHLHYRSRTQEWVIPHDELVQLDNEGLLPLPKL